MRTRRIGPQMCACGVIAMEGQRKCVACHNAYMREWRKTHPLSAEQAKKANCRSYSKVLLKRGTLTKRPCRVCGSHDAQMHHWDYDKPRLVEWLCKKHHRMLHELEPLSLAPVSLPG